MLAQFVAEILQVLFGQPAFEKGARVDAGRGVALEVDQVARLVAVAGVEEVVEADFEQRRQRGVGGNVAADAGVVLVLARTTMAMAFQRIRLLMRRSIARSPG